MLHFTQLTGLVLMALISNINGGVNPITIQPDKLVVEFGSSASANCSVSTTHHGMAWEASQGAVDIVVDVDFLTWKVESLTHWDIYPVCFCNTDEQWQLALQVTVYKRPDQVSISTVDHTGPMIEGRQYELRCDVQNVAPVRLLKVKWYKGEQLVQTDRFTDETKFPVNETVRLQVSPRRGDNGVQYRCEAELELGQEGPQPSPRVTSDPLTITVHAQSYNCADLVLDPPELVVRYGDPLSVSCRSLSKYTDLRWKVPQENMFSPVEGNVTWRTDNLTDWEIEPVCYMMLDGVECAKLLPIIIYKPPDQVSISVVNHTGPLIGGRKYELQCDIQNFAPLQVLSVAWYKGVELLKNRGFSNFPNKTPSNKITTLKVTLKITANRDDDDQYSCVAKLKLGLQSPPIVKSNLLKISVHYKPVINCPPWSPMINTTLNSYPYKVLANPPPNITWYRDETLFSLDMRLSRSDSGQYKFVASNVIGETSCVTKITVEYAPIFNCSGTYEGRENDTFKDKCLVMASPEAEITWKKSGKIINPLHHLTRGDSGSYEITAVNKHGTAENCFLVNVLYGPEIKPDGEVVKVKEGSEVSLSCSAEGNPEPVLTWSFQSETKATGMKQTELTISKVFRFHAGEYICTATNQLGSVTRKVSLMVERVKSIKIQPDKLVVEFGSSASASCSVSTIHHGMGWEASQGAIDMVEDVDFLTWKVESLTHWDIEPLCYYNTDEQWQLALQVTVYKRPDQVVISTVDHTGPMIEGRQYELQCDVQNVAPVRLLKVKWYKGQQLLQTDSFNDETKFPVDKTVRLQVSPRRGDDGVQYRCEAELELGPEGPQPSPRVTSDPLTITVHSVKPITIQPDKLVVEFGSSASASCSVSTTHGGMGWEASQGAVDMMEDVDFLTWKVESLTHWDIYPVCYYNTDEQWQLALQVTVYKRPDQVSISTVDHTGPMIEGRQYELRCDVQNVAPVRLLKVKWYKGQQLLQTDSFTDETKFPVDKTVRLQVSPQRGDDGIQYRCEAELELGPEGPQPSPRVTSDPLTIIVTL